MDTEATSLNEGSDSERDATIQTAVALRDEIYRLRGEILSEANSIEVWIDSAISIYFGQARHAMLHFQTLVLARISFAEKLQIVQQIVEAIGATDRMAVTLAKLRRAVEIRNNLAHSNVSLNMAVPEISAKTWKEFLRWQSVRQTRRGSQQTPVEIEVLQKEATFVASLGGELLRLYVVMTAAARGKDPLAAIDEFESMNPEIATAARTP